MIWIATAATFGLVVCLVVYFFGSRMPRPSVMERIGGGGVKAESTWAELRVPNGAEVPVGVPTVWSSEDGSQLLVAVAPTTGKQWDEWLRARS